jgi:hypothetical protein
VEQTATSRRSWAFAESLEINAAARAKLAARKRNTFIGYRFES